MVLRRDFLTWCNETLQTALFKDYAPNGLQIEGKEYIGKIATSVTASKAAIDFAAEQKADLLLVHHGMFWKNELPTITGWKKERIAALLDNDINMAAYHLPLDAHPELGNNAQLAEKLGFTVERRFGEQNLLNSGSLKQAKTLGALAVHIEAVLQRKPVVIGDLNREIRKVAWCSGEISEAQYHLANETGTAFVSAGHHATERYGVQALAEAAAGVFGLGVCHFDEGNPA